MKTRLLAVHQGHELYGSDRSFITTIKILKENHPNVFITVAIPKRGSIVEELEKYADEIFIEDIGVVAFSDAKKSPFMSLTKVIKSTFQAKNRINDADIIYINTIVPFGYILASFFTLKPVIIHIREIPSKAIAKIFAIWFKLCRFNTICNSHATQKAFNLSKKCEVIWNGVEKLSIDNTIEKNEQKIKLLLIGRINRWKGQSFFAETFAKLDDNQKNNFEVYIVGETPENQQHHKQELENIISVNNLEKYIKSFSFDKHPQKYYSWADVIIVPSVQPEPFGRVVIEAMSLAKAVIASNHGGPSEIVVDKKTGWLFEPNNKEQFREVLITILSNRALMSEYGHNGFVRYEQEFTLHSYEVKFLNYLSKIMTQR